MHRTPWLITVYAHCSSLLQELWQCYEDMQTALVKTPRGRRPRAVEGVGWVEVMVDLLLSLLSRPSQLWRAVATQVFRMVSSQITPSALQLILKVLPLTLTSELDL